MSMPGGLIGYNAGGVKDGLVARTDYAASVGTANVDTDQAGPTSLSGESTYNWLVNNSGALYNGVIFQRSEVRIADIRDGTSNTLLIGEKNLNPDNYFTAGADGYESENMYVGLDDDHYRWATPSYTPRQDQPSYCGGCFGSAHANSCNIACCDGSVQMISYSIDADVFSYLANRDDGKVIDAQRIGF